MKRTIFGITLVAMLGIVGIVGAQEPNRRGERNDEVHAIIASAIGLEGQELREALRDGATPAELIAANGGDVEAVSAEIAAAITAEHPELDAAEVAERTENILNGVRGERDGNLSEVIESATGLNFRELRQSARENNQTLAEAISANGGDVDAVVTALTAEITSEHPELDATEVAEKVDGILNKLPRERGENAPSL